MNNFRTMVLVRNAETWVLVVRVYDLIGCPARPPPNFWTIVKTESHDSVLRKGAIMHLRTIIR